MSTPQVRFDASSPEFERLSETLRTSVDRADRLLRRAEAAEEAGDGSYAREIRWKLARVEVQIDDARAALLVHVERTGCMALRRRRAKRVEPVKVAHGIAALVA